MDKIKAFFQNKIVKVVEGIVIAICAAGLIYGGVKAENIAKIPSLVVGVFGAVEALITIIQGFCTKSVETEKVTS